MRIGLIASNWRPIPGGEHNIYAPGALILALANGLVDKGHDVTLFGPKGTKTKAHLISEGLSSAYDDYPDLWNNDLAMFLQIEQVYEMMIISKAFEMANNGHFDILHAHKTNIEPFFSNLVSTPLVVTQHHSYTRTKAELVSPADTLRIKKYRSSVHYTAISHFMTTEVALNYVGVVYNGVNIDQFTYAENNNRQGILFCGRIRPEKGPDVAIQVAQDLNQKMTIVGDRRTGKSNTEFWRHIEPSFNNPLIYYAGFIPQYHIAPYYQAAKVTVLPIRTPEPFGLVMAESMACGTPVVAFDLGAAREIIDHGKTGFLVKPNDTKSMIQAVRHIIEMDKEQYQEMQRACRTKVEQNFTEAKMIEGYEKVYQKILAEH